MPNPSRTEDCEVKTYSPKVHGVGGGDKTSYIKNNAFSRERKNFPVSTNLVLWHRSLFLKLEYLYNF